ncbi:hypothetical protein [Virgibacillus chiguensis]|uniref:LXG domain of WXG superfamily protein n=1 Tax=Virgibacillus chiguensis TaxID=411959 RepID=A0A1M5WKB7_9BACI|nr:hypothetical protein [Virgibacillus chiguensis]SHH87921.1 hypothetical protein SAMN05421807_1173 [Virgibacillus chiguensis]
MKRDLQINYGVLDDIIGELRTYKRALEKMDDSLNKVSTFVQTNEGKSVEAWDQNISSSKEKIANYETQINDLLSLFENYVTDTTRYISPISRNTMMRVDRNDIWANLKQIEGGITNNLFKALNKSYQQPASFFGMFDDPTDAEKEASEINRRHMERIQTSIEATRKKLERNMDELWDLYHSKVKRFENADDEYNNLAGNVKRKYTNFFEGVMDVVSSVNKAVDDFEKGIVNSIAGMVTGLLTVVKDAGVVAVSGVVPDPVEPSWLKESADETVDAYTRAAIQFLQDPMRAVESTAQAFTDTVESEGVMYVTGAALPALIPSAWAVKGASGVAKLGAGAARRAPKLLDSKPFSGNYYREKVDAAKAGMVKVTEKFTFGKDYALSTDGATFILRDKDVESHVNPQMVNVKNGRGERIETKGAGKESKIDIGKADINALRKKWNVPETETVAVGKTDVKGLEDSNFEGGSPKVRKEAGLPDLDEVMPDRNIKAPGSNPLFTRHAEEGVLNEFDSAVINAGIKPEDVTGTLKLHQSNPSGVCRKCYQGLANDKVPPGVLKQLSLKYPNLKIIVTSEIDESIKVTGRLNLMIKNGNYID